MNDKKKYVMQAVERAISELEHRLAFEQAPASADTPMKIEIAEEAIDNRAEYVLLEAYKELRGITEKMRSHNIVLVKALKDAAHTAELEALRERAAKVADVEYEEWNSVAEHWRDTNNVLFDRCQARGKIASGIALAIRALPLTEKEAG